jgi:hypothetical protein
MTNDNPMDLVTRVTDESLATARRRPSLLSAVFVRSLVDEVIAWRASVACTCGNPSRPNVNHRKTIPCWTYCGSERINV